MTLFHIRVHASTPEEVRKHLQTRLTHPFAREVLGNMLAQHVACLQAHRADASQTLPEEEDFAGIFLSALRGTDLTLREAGDLFEFSSSTCALWACGQRRPLPMIQLFVLTELLKLYQPDRTYPDTILEA